MTITKNISLSLTQKEKITRSDTTSSRSPLYTMEEAFFLNSKAVEAMQMNNHDAAVQLLRRALSLSRSLMSVHDQQQTVPQDQSNKSQHSYPPTSTMVTGQTDGDDAIIDYSITIAHSFVSLDHHYDEAAAFFIFDQGVVIEAVPPSGTHAPDVVRRSNSFPSDTIDDLSACLIFNLALTYHRLSLACRHLVNDDCNFMRGTESVSAIAKAASLYALAAQLSAMMMERGINDPTLTIIRMAAANNLARIHLGNCEYAEARDRLWEVSSMVGFLESLLPATTTYGYAATENPPPRGTTTTIPTTTAVAERTILVSASSTTDLSLSVIAFAPEIWNSILLNVIASLLTADACCGAAAA
jgi:hypothetical protein